MHTRRVATWALLWAAPLGVALALVLLLVNAPYFRSGPGVPTAGDERAWGSMWGALGLVGLGCTVGGVANFVWLARAWRRRYRPGVLEWVRAGVNLALAIGFFWLWLFS